MLSVRSRQLQSIHVLRLCESHFLFPVSVRQCFVLVAKNKSSELICLHRPIMATSSTHNATYQSYNTIQISSLQNNTAIIIQYNRI